MARYRVLFIGERGENEFARHREWLAANTTLAVALNLNAAADHLVSTEHPFDLIVVAISRPGHCVPATWERLRNLAPLSPIIGLAASHCEGQAKTAGVSPGIVRVTATEFVSRVAQQLERMGEIGAMDWSPPFTATPEDRMLDSSRLTTTKLDACVMVISQRAAARNALCDSLSSVGASIVSYREAKLSDESAEVLLWDCSTGFDSSLDAYRAISRNAPRTPKIVILGFPRAEDLQSAYSQGADAVVSKPFLLDDLIWHIRQSLRKSVACSLG